MHPPNPSLTTIQMQVSPLWTVPPSLTSPSQLYLMHKQDQVRKVLIKKKAMKKTKRNLLQQLIRIRKKSFVLLDPVLPALAKVAAKITYFLFGTACK